MMDAPELPSRPAADARPLVSLPLLLALGVLLWGLWSSSVLSDPDSYWHVAVGRWMVAHHQFPVQDVFSHSRPGIPWTAHEWLSELVLWGAHQLGGFAGMQVVAATCFALTAGYLLRFLLRRLEPVHALPVWAVCVALISTHLLARPHVLVWPITALWVGLLVDAGERRASPPWWALLLVPLWANLHGSFIIAIGIAGLLAADAVMMEARWPQRVTAARPWAAFLMATAVLVCVNPHGPATFLHAVDMMRMSYMLAMINEWKSADFHEFQLLLVWIAGVLTLAFTGHLRLSPFRILFVGFFFYIALKHQRYHSLLGLVSPFVLAAPLARGLRQRAAPPDPRASRIDRWFAHFARPARTTGVVVALACGAGGIALAHRTMPQQPSPRISPDRALAAARRAGLSGPLFNAYAFGGYLIYQGVPVFVDGRADMYGDPFLAQLDTAVMMKRPHALESMLATYRITWTFLSANTPVVELLDHLPGWTRVYGDSVAVIHARQTAP